MNQSDYNMKRPKLQLSVVIITLNEADRLERLIAGIDLAHEVVVVDSGSTDGTIELAQRLGARVIIHEFEGYVAQKNFAMHQGKCDWLLSLDGDEALSDELKEEISKALARPDPEVAGFSMPRMSRYLGRWIRHGGWYPDRKVRLVRRGKATWKGEDPHDELVCNGRIEKLQYPILHYVYRNIADQVRTMNNFSNILAGHSSPTGGWYVILGFFHSVFKFIECYLWKMGFLDGLPGFVIAVNSAFYVFVRHCKRWEKGLEEAHRY
jgi:glycosyltransferase involved in cell wall biosynthesis